MKITEETIPLIERALDIELYPWQKEYLVNETPFPDICPCLMEIPDKQRLREQCNSNFYGNRCRYRNRQTGKTLAHCVRTALSEGYPLDISKPENFSDYGDGSIRYARGYYRRMFYDIWHQFKATGLPVRELIF